MSIEDTQSDIIRTIGEQLTVLAIRGDQKGFIRLQKTANRLNNRFSNAYEADNEGRMEGALCEMEYLAPEDAFKEAFPFMGNSEELMDMLEENVFPDALDLTYEQVCEKLIAAKVIG